MWDNHSKILPNSIISESYQRIITNDNYFRLQCGDCRIQEHFIYGVGRRWPGQNPSPLEALFPEHSRFDIFISSLKRKPITNESENVIPSDQRLLSKHTLTTLLDRKWISDAFFWKNSSSLYHSFGILCIFSFTSPKRILSGIRKQQIAQNTATLAEEKYWRLEKRKGTK